MEETFTMAPIFLGMILGVIISSFFQWLPGYYIIGGTLGLGIGILISAKYFYY